MDGCGQITMGESKLNRSNEDNIDLLANTGLPLSLVNGKELSNSDGLEKVQSTTIEDIMVSNHLVKKSQEKTSGREDTRLGPPDGQQDPGSENYKEKTLGR